MDESFIPFYGQVAFHYMDIPGFAYPFVSGMDMWVASTE
jgi:hypothetical protein